MRRIIASSMESLATAASGRSVSDDLCDCKFNKGQSRNLKCDPYWWFCYTAKRCCVCTLIASEHYVLCIVHHRSPPPEITVMQRRVLCAACDGMLGAKETQVAECLSSQSDSLTRGNRVLES